MKTRIRIVGGCESHRRRVARAARALWPRVCRYAERRYGFQVEDPAEIIVLVGSVSLLTLLRLFGLGGILAWVSRREVPRWSSFAGRWFGRWSGIFISESVVRDSSCRFYRPDAELRPILTEELFHFWELLTGRKGHSSVVPGNNPSHEETVAYYASQDHEYRALRVVVGLNRRVRARRRLLKEATAWRKKRGRRP